MFDYHSCGKHLGVVWYDARPCPECEKEHQEEIDQLNIRVDYFKLKYSALRGNLNPGKPLTENQIDRLE